MDNRIKTVISNLEKNNMQCFFVEKISDVPQKVSELISTKDSISLGGSVSLFESGVIDMLRNGDYNLMDRYADGLSKEELDEMYRKSFFCDAYISGTNAITENGELYNVDGYGNRVAAMIFGPKTLIVIAGINKIVKDIDEAVLRVKTVAAPKNCVRLGIDTYCHETGSCIKAENCDFSGCGSDKRICCDYVVMSKQRVKDRVKIILVGENLGF